MNYFIFLSHFDVSVYVCAVDLPPLLPALWQADAKTLLLFQLLRSSLVNNRTQAKVAEELGMQEYAITNDKTKRPVALRTKTLADLLECTSPALWLASTSLKWLERVSLQTFIEPRSFSRMSLQNVQFKMV